MPWNRDSVGLSASFRLVTRSVPRSCAGPLVSIVGGDEKKTRNLSTELRVFGLRHGRTRN